MTDTIDLYSDRGAKLKSGVDINDISPMRNAAIKNIVTGIKRTAAVDLAGIEKTLATSAIGGKGKRIRELRYKIYLRYEQDRRINAHIQGNLTSS